MAVARDIVLPEVINGDRERLEIDLRYYLSVLWRRRFFFIAAFAQPVLLALVLYVISPRQYRATAIIQIERKTPLLVAAGVSVDVDSWVDAQSFYPTQYRLLQSRGLAERVVRNLNLANDSVFSPSREGNSQVVFKAEDDALLVSQLATKLLERLEVKPVRDTRLVEVSFTAPNPELAARVANGVVEAYIDWGIETRSATVGRASGFLATQIEALKREIQDKELQLQAYGRRADIVALDPNSNVTLQRLEGLNRDYIQAVSERIQKEARFKELTSSPDEAVADLISGGLVGQLRAEQLKLEKEYATKLNIFKPDWPAMQELRARIDKGRQHLETLVKETVETARETARAEYQAALRREQALAAELERQKNEAMKLNSAAIEYNNLKVEVSTRRSLLDELLRKQAETEVSSRMTGARESNVLVVDRALPPAKHFRPSLVRNLFFGTLVGLLLGLGCVIGAEYADRRVTSLEELDRLLGFPVLAVVPEVPGNSYERSNPQGQKGTKTVQRQTGSIELLPVHQPKDPASEAYRTLRTMLLLSLPGGVHSVVVSSAVAGEGKTATAANLAVVLAQMGRRVVLVDADLRRSRQHRVFRVSEKLGLVNVLTGEVPPERALVPTDVPGLVVVPAGPQPPNPAELLCSSLMADFLTSLRSQFDMVVLDSPPILPVTDPSVLAAYCDGLLWCVGAGHVLREELRAARHRLQVAGVRVLGLIFNRFQPQSSRYGGYSGSYYYIAYEKGDGGSGQGRIMRRSLR